MNGIGLKTINRVVLIPPEQVEPNPAQPRVDFSEEELHALSDSIKQNGLLQPITVRRITGGKYQLISGERRLRASILAGLSVIPSIIMDTSDRQAAIFALIENIERQNLNYFEEAAAIKNLITEWGVSQQEVGERLGKAQPTIANKIRLLRFTEEERAALLTNRIPERHARALICLSGTPQFLQAVTRIAEHNLSAEEAEHMAKLLEQQLEQPKVHRKRKKPIIKDVRIFLNTIDRAITTMSESGVEVTYERNDSDTCIEYVVRIPI